MKLLTFEIEALKTFVAFYFDLEFKWIMNAFPKKQCRKILTEKNIYVSILIARVLNTGSEALDMH